MENCCGETSSRPAAPTCPRVLCVLLDRPRPALSPHSANLNRGDRFGRSPGCALTDRRADAADRFTVADADALTARPITTARPALAIYRARAGHHLTAQHARAANLLHRCLRVRNQAHRARGIALPAQLARQ